jgi:predicted MFS family arabinose efflux permease
VNVFQALGVRDFRFLWAARLVSALGSWLLVIAIPAHVLAATGSLRATGLVLAAEYVPFLLLGPVAGVLADQLDRRRLLIGTDLVRAGAVAGLLAADAGSWVVYAAVLVESAATVAARPAVQAHVPAVVGTGRLLSSANALGALTDGTVRLVGGPLGAVLLVVAGFPVLVGVDAATYLLSAVAVAQLRPRGRPNGGGPRPSFAAGLRVLHRYPLVRALLPATGVFLLANAALSALLVPLGVHHLGGTTAVGLVLSALGAGFLLGAPVLRLLVDRLPVRLLLGGSQAAAAAGLAGLVNTHSLPGALTAAAATGIAGAIVLGAPPTVVQRTVPGPALGRIGAVFGIVEAAATLAGAVAGPLVAQAAGLDVTVNTAAALALVGAAVTVWTVPATDTGAAGGGRADPAPVPAPGCPSSEGASP